MKKAVRAIILKILKVIAKISIKRNNPYIIFVCGDKNKTIIKNEIVHIMQSPRVRGNFPGYTFEVGIPLSIVNLEAGHSSITKWGSTMIKAFINAITNKDTDVLVLEPSITAQGDAKKILDIVQPDIIVFSDISQNQETKLKEFQTLIDNTNEKTVILVNQDQAHMLNWDNLPYKSFGLSEQSSIRAHSIQEMRNGQKFIYEHKGKSQEISLNTFGVHYIFARIIANFIKTNLKIA